MVRLSRTPLAAASLLAAMLIMPSQGVAQDNCPAGPAMGVEGQRRLALIVGIGRYASPSVRSLAGPPNDARRFYDLLTGPNGYEFPKENVCLLLDEQATASRFRSAFRDLARRASAGDVAVVFFAGHGSQAADDNGDESDGWDETLLLHDSRTREPGDLIDDEVQELLAGVQRKTRHVTAIFDSCNSASAQRGDAVARYEPPAASPARAATPRGTLPDAAAAGLAGELPGLVVLSAASDGTAALEIHGSGIFTEALISVLSLVGNRPLTYAQVSRQVPPLVAARSYQIPYFQGDLGKVVFDAASRTRPLALEVRSLSPTIGLAGPPIPGLGVGAELRVYDGAATGAETRDPGRAKATLVIDTVIGPNATAHVADRRPGAAAVKEGDLAVLVRPGDGFLKLRARLRPASEAGGLAADRSAALREAVQANEESRMSVETTTEPGDLELSVGSEGRLEIHAADGTLLHSFRGEREAAQAAESLWQFARQRAVLQLRGEGGADFVDGETLRVQMVPAPQQTSCATGRWDQAAADRDQIVPLCHRWLVRVTLSEPSPRALLIGGVALASDGSTFGFPVDGVQQKLRPGESHTFPIPKFEGSLPLERPEHLLVFGTQETNPVPWHLLTATAAQRKPQVSAGGPLFRALDRYLQPGARGTVVSYGEVEDTTWTMSSLRYRVRVPDGFGSRALDQACNPAVSCGRPVKARLEAGTVPDGFGRSLAVDGPILFVGAPGDGERGTRAGAVHLFRRERGGWALSGKLLSRETSRGDTFGSALAADGETLLVGSSLADLPGTESPGAVRVIEPGTAEWSRRASVAQAGAVYVFHRDRSGWTEESRLSADPPVFLSQFGSAVAIDDDRAVIGAPAPGRFPSAPGSAWIFQRTAAGWHLQTRLQASPSLPRDAFGSAVAIRGDLVAVGAPGAGEGLGTVHLFRQREGGWSEEARLMDPDLQLRVGFGSSLAFLDDLLLVGAPCAGEVPALPGRVHAFRSTGGAWKRIATVQAGDRQDGFGSTLAAAGSLLAVGGWREAHLLSRSGDTWQRTGLLHGEERDRYWFGNPVALAGSALLVGAAGSDQAGAVYAFELAPDGRSAGR